MGSAGPIAVSFLANPEMQKGGWRSPKERQKTNRTASMEMFWDVLKPVMVQCRNMYIIITTNN